ncbi:unnamed protein product [Durusdinium trenchii]|uniref:Phospholipid/glycerol acyltransferase domain-containing protein n=1 Tax=Durusdinium trenchii TaxID=1381693 RepID=A0ABP0IAZ1_9DINO
MVKQSSCVPGAMSYDSFREYKTVQPCSRLFHVQTILHTWTWVGILWHGWDLHVSTPQTPGHADTAGADPQVFHKERLDWIGRPGKHPVLVPNHISMLEAFYLEYLTWGMSGCVAKSQFAIPGVRSATQFSNAVAVDTKDKDVKQKVNEGILKFVHNEPDEKGRYPCGRAFVIYPEGITNSQRGLFRFNTGAFATGMAVQPVVQRFPYKYMNPAWVSDSRISRGNDLPWMMLRYMSQFHVPMQVKICEIWEPIEAERNDAVLYASNVQNFMALQLGIAVTNTGNKILRQKGGPFDLKSSQVQPGEETPSRPTSP